jgi:hypothetical protein
VRQSDSELRTALRANNRPNEPDKEMCMSETTSIQEQSVEEAGVVELGTASEQTRGSVAMLGLLDGGLYWPFIFVYR